MTENGLELSVQSYCFRTYASHAEVIEAVKAVGLSAVELCRAHLVLDGSQDAEPVVKQYADAGVAISSYGVTKFTTDEAAARRVFEFAKLAGFSAISTSVGRADADAVFAMLGKLGDEYDVNLAIHNHGRRDWLGPVWSLEDVFAKTSPRIGLCLDTAWMLDAAGDPLAVAARFADRLFGVHIKDFVFGRDGKPADVIVGTGNLDLPKLVAQLRTQAYGGHLTLEYEGDKDDPVPSTKACVAALQTACSAA